MEEAGDQEGQGLEEQTESLHLDDSQIRGMCRSTSEESDSESEAGGGRSASIQRTDYGAACYQSQYEIPHLLAMLVDKVKKELEEDDQEYLVALPNEFTEAGSRRLKAEDLEKLRGEIMDRASNCSKMTLTTSTYGLWV